MTERPDPFEAAADIGQIGVDAAAAVVERILGRGQATGGTAGNAGDGAAGGGPEARGRQLRRLQAEADRLIDLSADIVRAVLDTAVGLAADGRAPRPDAVVFGPAPPGSTAITHLWLHLLDGPAAGVATVRSTDLTAHHGGTIPSGRLVFDPPSLETSLLRTSHEIALRVDIPAEARPGLYHGYVLVTGLPEVALPVRLEVGGAT